MTPIEFTGSTHTMKGPPGSGIGDLPVASVPPHIISVWTFEPEERAAIAAGKNIMLSIMARGVPPVALAIAPDCCPQCGHEVKPGTEIVTNAHGDSFHKVCWDIGVAALECDLSAAMRENPDYSEIRPGVFDRTADAKARDEAARMTVFDPAIGNRYKDDGSDLISWAELVAFYPGGRLPSSARPTIVCLCGSTRFMEAFQRANLNETLAGKIVLSIGCNTKSDTDLMAAGELTEDLKRMLDELHKRKIDLADEVLVLNVGGYVGDSTRSEIEYARAKGKTIRWLEPD